MQSRSLGIIGIGILVAAATACGGGGGGAGNRYGGPPPPTSTTPPGTTQQVVRAALPSSAIGTENDPTFGLIAGYTQTQTSQVLGYSPGQQVMIENAQSTSSGVPHTLGDTGGQGGFPQNANLSMQSNTPNGGTLSAGFQTGTIQPQTMRGPFTLATGTYFIGCFYHFAEGMRDVLVVAAGAGPGPAATPPPGQTPVPSGGGY
jgi:hypothetical protein